MEIKKIIEGMTAPEVAKIIDDNFNAINQENALVSNAVNSNRYGFNVTVNGLRGGVHSLETAIKDVPGKYRMLGQKITFDTGAGWVTYQFENLAISEYEKESEWKQISGIKQVSGDINITNKADEEDITSSADGVIRLADKEHVADSFSGLGRKYLRKNIQTVTNEAGEPVIINRLTQDMLSWGSTRYIIQYDFDLNGAEITVPEGCVLDFQGGSLSNGTLIGNDTIVNALEKQCFYNMNFKGTFSSEFNIVWLGADRYGIKDCSDVINLCFGFDNTIFIPKGKFRIDKQIEVPYGAEIKGVGNASQLYITYDGVAFYANKTMSDSNKGVAFKVSHVKVIGTYPSWFSSDKVYSNTSFYENAIDTYVYENIFDTVDFIGLKVPLRIHRAYWTKIINCNFRDGNIAADLSCANASTIVNNTFRGYDDRGIVFRYYKNTDGAIESSTNGCNITGNNFSEINYAGLHITGVLSNSEITGNYFECRAGRAEEGYEFVIGDRDANCDECIPTLNSCIVEGNSGLWSPYSIHNFGKITESRIYHNVVFDEDKGSSRNLGKTESNHTDEYTPYNEVYYYGTKYIGQVKESYLDRTQTLQFRNVCVPANSSIRLHTNYITVKDKLFQLLYYYSDIDSVKLTIAIDNGTNIIIDKQGSMQEPISTRVAENYKFETNENIILTLDNTSEKNVACDVIIKLSNVLYG